MEHLRSSLGPLRSRAMLTALLVVAASALSAMAAVPPASAYSHEWACYEGAYGKCYDNTGKTYNHWHVMSFSGEYTGGYCVKGETGSGGVIQFDCRSGSNYASGVVCTGTETHAYGYSNVNGQFEVGYANTEGGC